jgi:hypothetical protein
MSPSAFEPYDLPTAAIPAVSGGPGRRRSLGAPAWHEPHPGRRPSWFADNATSQWIGRLMEAQGEGEGDMAAEGSDVHHAEAPVRPGILARAMRKGGRRRFMRRRWRAASIGTGAGVVGPLPLCSTEAADAFLDAIQPPQELLEVGSESVVLGQQVAHPADAHMDIDGDTDVETIVDNPLPVVAEAQLPRIRDTAFADLSGYFGTRSEVDRSDDERSLTVYEGDVPMQLTPQVDPYGWEAELDRKTSLAMLASSTAAATKRRRQHSPRRNLLHRVLSMATSDESF